MDTGAVLVYYISMARDTEQYNAWRRERWRGHQKELQELKSAPCADCRGVFPHYVMEFDHVPERGKKKKNLPAIIGGSTLRSKTFQDELAKCDLVCANCHKVRTHNRGQQRQNKRCGVV